MAYTVSPYTIRRPPAPGFGGGTVPGPRPRRPDGGYGIPFSPIGPGAPIGRGPIGIPPGIAPGPPIGRGPIGVPPGFVGPPGFGLPPGIPGTIPAGIPGGTTPGYVGDIVTSGPSGQNPADIAAFWTEERMRNAQPYPMGVPGPAGGVPSVPGGQPIPAAFVDLVQRLLRAQGRMGGLARPI